MSQSGYDGQQVTLDVEDEGTLVSTQQVTLPDAGTPASIPVRFTVTEAGPRSLRFRVSPQPGELVTENNAREALIDVRDRKEKILYFEGEPRFEYKFIRRAIPEGDNIIVTSLIRTADNKYMRQGVDGRRARRGLSEDARRAVPTGAESAASKPAALTAISRRKSRSRRPAGGA